MSKKRDDYYEDEYEEDYTDESESDNDSFSVHFVADDFNLNYSEDEKGEEEEEEEEEEEPNEGILSENELDKLLRKKTHTINDRIMIVRHYWESHDDDEFRRKTVSKELRDFFDRFFARYGVDYDEHLVERAIRAFFVRVQSEGENIIEKLRDILNRTRDNSGKKDYGGMMRKAVLTADAGLLLSTVYEAGKFTKKNQKYQAKAYARGVKKPSRKSTKQANPEARHLPLKQRKPIEEKRKEMEEAKRQADMKDMFRYHHNAEYRKKVDEENAKKKAQAGKGKPKKITPFSGGGGGKGRSEKARYKPAPDPKTRVLNRKVPEKHCEQVYCLETDIDADGYCKEHRKIKGKGKAPMKRPPRPPPSSPSDSDSDLSSMARDQLFDDMIAGPSRSVEEYRRRADRWDSGGGGASSSSAKAAEDDDDADDSLWKQARAAAKRDRERQAAAEESEKKRKHEQDERFLKKKAAYQSAQDQATEAIRRRKEEQKRLEEERKRKAIQEERERAKASR